MIKIRRYWVLYNPVFMYPSIFFSRFRRPIRILTSIGFGAFPLARVQNIPKFSPPAVRMSQILESWIPKTRGGHPEGGGTATVVCPDKSVQRGQSEAITGILFYKSVQRCQSAAITGTLFYKSVQRCFKKRDIGLLLKKNVSIRSDYRVASV